MQSLKRLLSILSVGLVILLSRSVVFASQDDFATISSQLAALNRTGEQVDSGIVPTVTDKDTPTTSGKAYYVSVTGNDANSGTSPNKPWASLARVNQQNFKSGDRILFKAGDSWLGQTTLMPKGDDLTISSYGTGNLPKLAGQGKVADVIKLENQKNITISNLNINNNVKGFNYVNGNKLADLRGIHVVGKDAGNLSGYFFHNLYVHDVTGNDIFIGGNVANNKPGVIFKGGWDRSKDTGGIVFDIAQPATSKPTTFSNVNINNNIINNNSYGGIIFKQWQGNAGTNENWASRDDAKASNDYQSSTWAPHTNINVTNNYINQSKSKYACDAIYLTSVKDSKIEGNITKGAGTSGIEVYYGDNVLIQHNDTSNSVPKAGGADSNGIDPDKETTRMIIQYNYIHGNGDGILLCGIKFSTTVVRYNVIADNGKVNSSKNSYINIHGDTGKHDIYNNVFYAMSNQPTNFIYSSAGQKEIDRSVDMHTICNNIFYNSGNGLINVGEGKGTSYSNNDYYNNVNIPSQDQRSIKTNPNFIGVLYPNSEYSDLNKLKLSNNSNLKKHGIRIVIDNGINPIEKDFLGNLILQSGPAIGIIE
ncbi:right-handed parallel beta-helix repeat-containing protein [Lactobacillus sp. ESL0677]|uniref:right-handed parallel beta-helix repeat-containing protein n=1 Tax=Lactobacillus sp. ESL0677 TaxID=2983208 RepID=UPI0023F82232|nr:right-handed parallel beta-helix repeat-containing protein [Lactobacillus sp. ESL0677]WEV36950.1 right-handed parallel beta-helix repeat-containing protein [Lactobacillus sp. ESL0677]